MFFILLIAGFLHVARKGDMFSQPPTGTAALWNEELTRRRDPPKFMARGTTTHSTPMSGSRGVLLSLPLYTSPAHPRGPADVYAGVFCAACVRPCHLWDTRGHLSDYIPAAFLPFTARLAPMGTQPSHSDAYGHRHRMR